MPISISSIIDQERGRHSMGILDNFEAYMDIYLKEQVEDIPGYKKNPPDWCDDCTSNPGQACPDCGCTHNC